MPQIQCLRAPFLERRLPGALSLGASRRPSVCVCWHSLAPSAPCQTVCHCGPSMPPLSSCQEESQHLLSVPAGTWCCVELRLEFRVSFPQRHTSGLPHRMGLSPAPPAPCSRPCCHSVSVTTSWVPAEPHCSSLQPARDCPDTARLGAPASTGKEMGFVPLLASLDLAHCALHSA